MKFLLEVSKPCPVSSSAAQTSQSGDPLTRDWRFGPARVWYDSIGVPEDGQSLDYGFQLKVNTLCGGVVMLCTVLSLQERDSPFSPAEEEGKQDVQTPDDAFLMATLEHWEDRVLTDVPYTPSPPISGMGGVWRALGAGENPSFPRHNMTARTISADSGTMAGEHSPQTSLFPIENYQLVYGHWEDDVIWDSQAVKQIPTPSLAQIDPNDPNFIIGLPEESPAVLHTVPREKDSRKVGVCVPMCMHVWVHCDAGLVCGVCVCQHVWVHLFAVVGLKESKSLWHRSKQG